jgi:hypothetical protein
MFWLPTGQGITSRPLPPSLAQGNLILRPVRHCIRTHRAREGKLLSSPASEQCLRIHTTRPGRPCCRRRPFPEDFKIPSRLHSGARSIPLPLETGFIILFRTGRAPMSWARAVQPASLLRHGRCFGASPTDMANLTRARTHCRLDGVY